eukprot:3939816-Rhodomonas_salina.3
MVMPEQEEPGSAYSKPRWTLSDRLGHQPQSSPHSLRQGQPFTTAHSKRDPCDHLCYALPPQSGITPSICMSSCSSMPNLSLHIACCFQVWAVFYIRSKAYFTVWCVSLPQTDQSIRSCFVPVILSHLGSAFHTLWESILSVLTRGALQVHCDPLHGWARVYLSDPPIAQTRDLIRT